MKRMIQLALALLAIAAMLIGCAAPAAPAAPAAESWRCHCTGRTRPAAAGDAAAGEKTKVLWWGEDRRARRLQDKFQQQFVDVFNAEHPDIELEIVWQENTQRTSCAPPCRPARAPISSRPPAPATCSNTRRPASLLPLDDFATEYGWKDTHPALGLRAPASWTASSTACPSPSSR